MSSESPPEENELGLGLINRYRHKIKKERKKKDEKVLTAAELEKISKTCGAIP